MNQPQELIIKEFKEMLNSALEVLEVDRIHENLLTLSPPDLRAKLTQGLTVATKVFNREEN